MSIVTAQFLLPFLIGFIASSHMSYHTIFIVCGIAMLIDAGLVIILPFPQLKQAEVIATTNAATKGKPHLNFNKSSVAAILPGFTTSTTFMLWLNCNQELGQLYGIKDASVLQSCDAFGAALGVLATAQLIKLGLKETTILVLYPAISVVMLLLCYVITAPFVLYIGSVVIGYVAVGGLLQLATSTTIIFFPLNKGLATSMVMIASSIANYAVLSGAAYITNVLGKGASRVIVLLNVGITIIGIILSVIVKKGQAQKI
ncbi:putative MFS family arabinose efflux permease [Weissella beninensis]|uniref:Major facilitator superfamily (MFS) profile domain-containing protein n=1 Tax=Periweissella beninensis TaxID=504936 RepID=A0ABT0VG43_9LACO|nr:putative MFS family arabinose efflux permease [Periweissella beninensis]MCM2436797.1 hypothetical protein [Periweissella beninensis]